VKGHTTTRNKRKSLGPKLVESMQGEPSGTNEMEARSLVTQLLDALQVAANDSSPSGAAEMRLVAAIEELGHFTLAGARTMDSMVAYGNGGYTMQPAR
jgi:hypothetical protein